MERKARLESGFASMRPIVSLSLFYVLFLSMESLLGERAAAFLPPDAVAFAGSVAAAASLVGFLLYALVRMRVPGFASLIHASGTLSAVGLLATSLVPGALTLLASGLATMFFVGFAGAAAHEALARRFADGPEIAAYLRGETLHGTQRGWTLLTAGGLSLGWVRGADGILKNQYPKGLRRLR